VDDREVSTTIVRIRRGLTQSVAIRVDELDHSDNYALSCLELAGEEQARAATIELARIADHNIRAWFQGRTVIHLDLVLVRLHEEAAEAGLCPCTS
jgi:hypothetical protein